ncbi:DUF4192 domain-containing protein [Terrabacter sp. LjRoot27]|uniref:DUF4192 domain-containing protein n=1 Tax=Terrabacter sp. LjRoot27 TaxID=3342306 RepID=UPI003ECD8946
MPKISLSGPAELLTVIPFHLGFQPTRSVVVVCFHGKRLGLVARLDLVDETLAPEAVAQTLPTLLQGSPSSVALVGFEDDEDESLPLLEALAAGVESERVVVRERLVVRDGRWRSVGCDCCPDEGWRLPEQADVPAVASYVALGHAVLPDRDELARLVAPLDFSEPRHDLAVAAIEDWQRRYAAAGGPISEKPDPPGRRRGPRRRIRPVELRLGLLDGGEPTPRQFLVNESLVAWGGVLRGEIEGFGVEHWLPSLVGPLRDREVRDALMSWLCPGMLPTDTCSDDVAVLLELLLGPDVRMAPASGDLDDVPWPSGRTGGGGATGRGVGADVGARLPDPDRDALRALRELLAREAAAAGTGPGGDGSEHADEEGDEVPESDAFAARRALDERDELGEMDELDELDALDALAGLLERVEREAWDGIDGPAGEPGWDDWDGAATPRLLLSRLEQVCRLTPAAHAAPLLSVVASLAWWCGDGARAGVAVDHALALEPDHSLGTLVRDALDHGLRPRRCA